MSEEEEGEEEDEGRSSEKQREREGGTVGRKPESGYSRRNSPTFYERKVSTFFFFTRHGDRPTGVGGGGGGGRPGFVSQRSTINEGIIKEKNRRRPLLSHLWLLLLGFLCVRVRVCVCERLRENGGQHVPSGR